MLDALGFFIRKIVFLDIVFDRNILKKYCRSDDTWLMANLLHNGVDTEILAYSNRLTLGLGNQTETRFAFNTRQDLLGVSPYDYCTHNVFLLFNLYKKLEVAPIKALENTGLVDIEHLF